LEKIKLYGQFCAQNVEQNLNFWSHLNKNLGKNITFWQFCKQLRRKVESFGHFFFKSNCRSNLFFGQYFAALQTMMISYGHVLEETCLLAAISEKTINILSD